MLQEPNVMLQELLLEYFPFFLVVVGIITYILQRIEEYKFKKIINTFWVIGLVYFLKNLLKPELLNDVFSE